MFFQFGFKALDQGERVGRAAGESGKHTSVVEFSDFSCGPLDDDIAEGDLSVATQCDAVAATDRYNGCPVKLFHMVSYIKSDLNRQSGSFRYLLPKMGADLPIASVIHLFRVLVYPEQGRMGFASHCYNGSP